MKNPPGHWASRIGTLPIARRCHTVPEMLSVGSVLRCLGAHFHGLCGWLAYRLGCRSASRAHFERVLLLSGADFRAYVHLGRIAFDIGDYAGWRRELEHARRLDPERFSRLRHPLELFEPRLAGTSIDRLPTEDEDFDDSGERATWRTLRPSGSNARNNLIRNDLIRNDGLDPGLDALLPGLDARGETTPPRFAAHRPNANQPRANEKNENDDCVSSAERSRFRELGPIVAAEIEHCDIDDLLRRLTG